MRHFRLLSLLFVLICSLFSCSTTDNDAINVDSKLLYKPEYQEKYIQSISLYKKGMDCDAINLLLDCCNSILFRYVNYDDDASKENELGVVDYFVTTATKMLSRIVLVEQGNEFDAFSKKIRVFRSQVNNIRTPVSNANIQVKYSDKYGQIFITNPDGVIKANSPYLDIESSGQVEYSLIFPAAEVLSNNYNDLSLTIFNFLELLDTKKLIYQYSSLFPLGKIIVSYNIKSDVPEIRDPQIDVQEIIDQVGLKDYLDVASSTKDVDFSLYRYKVSVDCFVDEVVKFDSSSIVHLLYNLYIENLNQKAVFFKVENAEILGKGGELGVAIKDSFNSFYSQCGKIIRSKILEDSLKLRQLIIYNE